MKTWPHGYTRTHRRPAPPPPKITVSITVEKPPVVDELSWYQEYDRRAAWLRKHCLELIEFNRKMRKFGATPFRQPLKWEPNIPGVNDLAYRRAR